MKRFEYAHVAEGIARQAGALLREFYAKGVATEYKGDVDLVTEADRSAEKMIREKLTAAFPGHGIYGEEGTRDQLDSEFRWYVDPLDGTTNFAHGFPAFCVILGLERRAPGLAKDADGEIIAGVIYDPLRDEMFSAERGKGAFLNGKAIHVSKTRSLAESLTATGFPSHRDIYLTPPTPRCSVWGHGRGLSADFIGSGAAFQQRRSLYRVSCSTALARRLGLSTVCWSRCLVDPAGALALRSLPVRDVGHRGNHLSGHSLAADPLVPRHVADHQSEERHQRFGPTAGARPGQLQDRVGHAA
jgi:fructose-1,6-bisphosphatase/inositol monophosphatase family enzyme